MLCKWAPVLLNASIFYGYSFVVKWSNKNVGLLSLTEKGELVLTNMIVRLSRDGQTVKFKQKHTHESWELKSYLSTAC